VKVETPLSLKYRPKKLSQVVGQPVVVRAFTNAFKINNLHHAYILAGQFGCGKTTVARIVAATENCLENKKDPCGKCNNCQEIFAGKSYEVLEIDAGSEGKVDNIRALHKSLHQCPVECKTKYVIIDEAHSLTGSAAEASLKMIEEPPPMVRFILATTEPQAFKETIHSRCIMWSFNKVGRADIFSHLQNISQQEQIGCDDKTLQLIARYSKGSVRNSLQHLQKIMNYVGDDSITYESAVEALGVIDDVLYFDLFDGIIAKDAMKCFMTINKIFCDGKEAKLVIDGVYEHLNNLLVTRTCRKDLDSFDFTQEEAKRYIHQNSTIAKSGGDDILRMMNLLSNVSFGVEYSLNPAQLLNKFAVESIRMFAKR
jgi:DNA polymerase III subunit gamma/tau